MQIVTLKKFSTLKLFVLTIIFNTCLSISRATADQEQSTNEAVEATQTAQKASADADQTFRNPNASLPEKKAKDKKAEQLHLLAAKKQKALQKLDDEFKNNKLQDDVASDTVIEQHVNEKERHNERLKNNEGLK